MGENFSESESKTKTAGFRNGWKMIKGRGNLCLGYAGRYTYVRNRRCNGARNVQWRFIYYGGNYIIQNRSGYVLRIYGSHVKAWPRQNNTPQRWYVQHLGGGKYYIKNHYSRKCLYCAGYTSYNYHFMNYYCRNNAHYQYYIVNAQPKNANISGGWKMIKGRGNLCVGYVSGNTYIRNRRCNGASNVQWRFVRYGGNYIIQHRTGKVLRIYSIYIYTWPRQNNTPQRWYAIAVGGGKHMIKNHSSRKCLYCPGYTSYNYHYNHYNCNKNNAHFQYYIINAQQKNVNVSGGWKMIKGRGNYCVGYVGGNSYIRNRRCTGASNVQWRFIKYGGNYIIQNRSGKVLRIYSIYIYSWPRQNNTPQRWYVHKAAG